MTKLSQEKVSELNLVGRINNRMLNGMGVNLVKGEFEQLPIDRSSSNSKVSLNESQFNYLLELCNRVTSGVNPSDKVVAAAKMYLLEREKFEILIEDRSTKALGKRVATRRLLVAHNSLIKWPDNARGKIEAYSMILGGRTPSEETISAVVEFLSGESGVNKACSNHSVNYASVKNVLYRVEQFDLAAEEYSKL